MGWIRSAAEADEASGQQALRLLDEALALWRGPAVGEFAGRPFALATAARLNELRPVAAERRAELLLTAGLVEEAVATLQALLAEHPEREQARGLFMQALYRAGRLARLTTEQADTLLHMLAYREAIPGTRLGGELGAPRTQ
jgi:DNA-binding SARP family transcriptional activator